MTENPNYSDRYFSEHFLGSPVMVILRGLPPAETVRLCERAVELGLSLIEVPVQSEATFESLRAAIAWGQATGHEVGAGTITSVALLRQVADAGATFTVAPGSDLAVMTESDALQLPHLPGVGTATEVHHALVAGFRWQKAFPAAALGTNWISAMHGPFPAVKFVATGGITAANAGGFLQAGAGAVSLGSAFATSDEAGVRALSNR